MRYSETLLDLSVLPPPIGEALEAATAVILRHDDSKQVQYTSAIDPDLLMPFEVKALLKRHPEPGVYLVPKTPEEKAALTNRAAASQLDFHHDPALQAEFGDWETYDAYIRHADHSPIVTRN